MTKSHRIIIYPKDIALITGKSNRYARLLINKIKIHLDKQAHQMITIDEFADYIGVESETVYDTIYL